MSSPSRQRGKFSPNLVTLSMMDQLDLPNVKHVRSIGKLSRPEMKQKLFCLFHGMVKLIISQTRDIPSESGESSVFNVVSCRVLSNQEILNKLNCCPLFL